jgi:hypothetical protein
MLLAPWPKRFSIIPYIYVATAIIVYNRPTILLYTLCHPSLYDPPSHGHLRPVVSQHAAYAAYTFNMAPPYSSPCYGRHSMFTLANVLLYLYMISIVPRIHLSGIVSSLGFSNGFTTPPTENIYDPLIGDRRTISVFGHIYNIIRNISRRIRSLGENPQSPH